MLVVELPILKGSVVDPLLSPSPLSIIQWDNINKPVGETELQDEEAVVVVKGTPTAEG